MLRSNEVGGTASLLSSNGNGVTQVEIEQAAFAPGHVVNVTDFGARESVDDNRLHFQVEGFEPSEDPVLQSRIFAYPGMCVKRIKRWQTLIPVL
jgi:catalase